MAYIINPDGTIKPVEVEYDAAGNILPKRDYGLLEPYHNTTKGIQRPTHTGVSGRKKKKKSVATKNVVIPSEKPKAVARIPIKIVTRQSIDRYFLAKKKKRQAISTKELLKATSILRENLLRYFMQRYDEHNEYCRLMGWPKKRTKEKQAKKNGNIDRSVNHASRQNTSRSIADIAKFSTFGGASGEGISEANSVSIASRRPKYGYARDRYGRVQERDSYNEERKSEFKQAQKRQSSYDYSNYDSEDDHDSYYVNSGYD